MPANVPAHVLAHVPAHVPAWPRPASLKMLKQAGPWVPFGSLGIAFGPLLAPLGPPWRIQGSLEAFLDPSACQELSSTAPAHRIKPRGNSKPVQLVKLVPLVPDGKDISAPAEDLHNENPSLVALGQNPGP